MFFCSRLTPLRRIAVVLFFAALFTCAAVPFAAASTDLRGDFETGDASQWEGFEYHGVFTANYPASNQLQIETTQVRQGRYAAKFTLNPGDQYGGSSGERALLRYGGSHCSCESEGQDFYYSWSTLFPTDWVAPPGWGGILEFHGDSRFMLAPIRFNAGGDSLSVDMTTGQCTSVYVCAYAHNTQVLSTLSKGRWNDFILHVHWTKSSNGVVEIWHRLAGNTSWDKVVTLTNIPTMPWYAGQAEPTIYIEYGLYTDHGTTTRSVYGDAFSRSTSYADAAAMFGDPTPAPAPAPAPAPTPAPAPAPQPAPAPKPAPAPQPAPVVTPPAPVQQSAALVSPPSVVTPPVSAPAASTSSASGAASSSGSSSSAGGPAGGGPAGGPAGGAPAGETAQVVGTPATVPAPALAPAPAAPALAVSQVAQVVRTPVAAKDLRGTTFVRTTLHVAGADRLTLSLVGKHGALPLLARSRVGGIRIGYWRKAIVVRATGEDTVSVALRVPAALLGRHLVLHARVEGQQQTRTLAIPFSPARAIVDSR